MTAPIHTWLMVGLPGVSCSLLCPWGFSLLRPDSEAGLRVGSGVHDHYRFDPCC